MEEQEKEYEVRGKVTGQHGAPLKDAQVVVWWQHIRTRKELGRGETSDSGQYRIKYKVPNDFPARLLIVVQAGAEGSGKQIFSPITEAQQSQEIDLSLETPDDSEWATMLAAINPLLDGLKLTDLVENADHQETPSLRGS